MVNIAYLVVIMADSTSETWCQLTNDTHGHHTVLNRTEIHAILAEISKMSENVISGLWAIWGAHALESQCEHPYGSVGPLLNVKISCESMGHVWSVLGPWGSLLR